MNPRFPGDADVWKQTKLFWLRAVVVCVESDSVQYSIIQRGVWLRAVLARAESDSAQCYLILDFRKFNFMTLCIVS